MSKISFDDVMQTIVTFNTEQLLDVNRAVVALIRDSQRRNKLVAGVKFRVGQHVEFNDKQGRRLVGVVTKVMRVNMQIRVQDGSRTVNWRVSNNLVRPVSAAAKAA